MKESQLRLADLSITTIDLNQLRRGLVKSISYGQVAAARGADPALWKAEFNQMLDAAKAAVTAVAKSTTPVGTVRVASVTVAPKTSSGAAASTVQLVPTVLPADAFNKSVTYSSSDATKATVSAGGLVTRVATGSATITVTTVDGGKTDTAVITIT